MKILYRILATVMAMALTVPTLAQAASDTYERKWVFDTTENGILLAQAVTGLPVLVRLHSGNFAFSEAKPDGSDIRFFAADGKTPLNHLVEKYDATNELAVLWVKLPTLAANSKDSTMLMKWGQTDAAVAVNAKATFDDRQSLVLNFSEADGYQNAAPQGSATINSTATPVVAGPIGAAVAFDGTNNLRISTTPAAALQATEGWTVSAWIKPNALDTGSIFQISTDPAGLSIELAAGALTVKGGGATAVSTGKLLTGIWQHIAVVYADGKVNFYLEGEPAGEQPLVMPVAQGDVTLGQGLRGELDALVVSNTGRSAAYIQAQAASQAADSLLMGFDTGEAAEAELSYMAILLGAVTLDGWIVIGILGVMAVMSLWVMIEKMMTLSAAEKANVAFLEYFRVHSRALLQPGHPETEKIKAMPNMAKSPLFQMYQLGLSEITQRFSAHAAEGRANYLSTSALESIRASLDATIVRTSQRLNKGIVLLTISISGGPFLGLLGTVVGVMITFAAIAAAGDVNVNAIAPGIAAALVATVAGLAVAIPALFAYNWFAIRIKNIAADIQVFADEFLTKSAELHCEQ